MWKRIDSGLSGRPVTGANRGIGQAIAVALASAGADVIAVGQATPTETLASVAALGREGHFVQANLESTAPIERVLAEALAAWLRLQVENDAALVRVQVSERARPFEARMVAGGAGSPSADEQETIRDICRGGSYLSPRMLSQLVDDFRTRIKSANRMPRFATLTTRERELLGALANGWTNLQISARIGISQNTVKYHLKNLYDKLGVKNRAMAVALYMTSARDAR